MKSGRNVVFLILAAVFFCCQVSFAESPGMETGAEDSVAVVLDTAPESYTKEEIDAMLGQIMASIPKIPKRYTNEEIDAKIAEVKDSIPDVSGNYTNDQIDSRIEDLTNTVLSIPKIPDVYSKEEIRARIRALNDAIANLEIALFNVRDSIPEEIKWPVKTKKILTDIRNSIPSDIVSAIK